MQGVGRLFVHVAPVCDPHDTHELEGIVNQIHHTPVTDPNPPLIPVPFQLFAPCGSWEVTQRFDVTNRTRQYGIR